MPEAMLTHDLPIIMRSVIAHHSHEHFHVHTTSWYVPANLENQPHSFCRAKPERIKAILKRSNVENEADWSAKRWRFANRESHDAAAYSFYRQAPLLCGSYSKATNHHTKGYSKNYEINVTSNVQHLSSASYIFVLTSYSFAQLNLNKDVLRKNPFSLDFSETYRISLF